MVRHLFAVVLLATSIAPGCVCVGEMGGDSDGGGTLTSDSGMTDGAPPPVTGYQPDPTCILEPAIEPFDGLVPEVYWTGAGGALPEWNEVITVPVVIELVDDDPDPKFTGAPEIVFLAFRNDGSGNRYKENAIIRVISGSGAGPGGVDGTEHWFVFGDGPPNTVPANTSAAAFLDPTAHLTAADISGPGGVPDGYPDLIAIKENLTGVVAYDHEGHLLWDSPHPSGSESGYAGASAVADLDGDGLPEVIVGRTVLEGGDGSIRFIGNGGGAGGVGKGNFGPISCVADLDGDGRPEIVAGNSAYSGIDGALLWTASTTDGFCGIADFDLDGAPEVALVTDGKLQILNAGSGTILASANLPGGGHGGPPNIGDFDGDGLPEVGTAGMSKYSMFDVTPWALSAMWSANTEDDSSNRTGSSLFDFNGDGQTEVIYNDEVYLRVLDGALGTVLFETLSSSRTRSEYPVVADADGDGKAEIVSVASDEAGFLNVVTPPGIRVWGDPLDRWVLARPLWNQHSYHITNSDNDGRIPAVELENWLVPDYNNYRMNVAAGLDPLGASDLWLEPAAECEAIDVGWNLHITVVNTGLIPVPAGVMVSVYDADPATGALPIATGFTDEIVNPGATTEVAVLLGVDTSGATLWVVIDDAGEHRECDEGNNSAVFVGASCGVPLG